MASTPAGTHFPDPFSRERAFGPTFWHAILATALFRCWHLLLFFAAWSTAISVISHTTKDLGISSTLLTVFVKISLRASTGHLTYRVTSQTWYRPWFCHFLQNNLEF